MKHKYKYSKFKSFTKHIKGYKQSQKYHIETIFAQIGAGKSTDIAKQCLKIYRKGTYKHIYANIDINLPFVRKYAENDLKRGTFRFPADSIIFCDEAGIVFNNRDYKNFSKELNKYIRKARHFRNSFIFYSQDYLVEKTLRSVSSNLGLIKKFGPFSIKRKIIKIIDVDRPREGQNTEAAECAIHDSLKFANIFQKNAIEITFIPFYSNLFNSFDIDETVPEIDYCCYHTPNPPTP
ncbi:MAG: hypothetical protein MJ232_04590 [archaeon]|nr:hypothetical protein [archaeon]